MVEGWVKVAKSDQYIAVIRQSATPDSTAWNIGVRKRRAVYQQ